MTDLVKGIDQAQSLDTSASASNMPVQSHAPASEEKLFRQHDVNEIVGRAKHEAVERYKRQMQESAQIQSYENRANVSEDHIKQIAAKEAERLRNEWVQEAQRNAQEQEAKKIAEQFFTKLQTGKDKYADFDATIGELEFGAIPHVVQLATMVDNTPDVMYELAKNPTKIANLQQLLNISPKLAYAEMARLSKTLKDNEQASHTRLPNDPLSQLKPTNTGTDNGNLSIADLKRKYRA